ncbi:MAG: Smr/MutS family protein [Proteobacteria bacterium]|nr:Smr/MutS family protein [Pseudomonadota bacterium]
MTTTPSLPLPLQEGGDDAALFREAIGVVTPLAEQNRISPPKTVTQARVRLPDPDHQIADTLSDYHHDNSPEEYLSNGLSRLTLRKLRRSAVQDSLDLHGHTIDAARMLLQQFLFNATQHQLRCVLVIHGKGMNSPDGYAVLRALARNWLTQHPQVLAFCAAPPESGGGGAVLILLKIRP